MGLTNLRADPATKSDLKFEKKLQFYAKVKDTVASLAAKKTIGKKKKLRSRQKKLKAYDLSNLQEFLPDLKTPQQPVADFKLNCKNRQKLLLKEGKQLRGVLAHPAFQANPLGSILQHLQSTQPIDEKPAKSRTKDSRAKKKAKAKRSKTASEPQSMDI